MSKCGNCQRAEGTEWVSEYQLGTGMMSGNYFVCLPCLPIEQKSMKPMITPKSKVADGVCPNCDGSGKYFYSGGAVGICYQCNGKGKDKN